MRQRVIEFVLGCAFAWQFARANAAGHRVYANIGDE